MTTMKTYLGDGVFVRLEPCGLVLTTEDSVRTTNTIVLEADVWRNLREFVERMQRKA